MSIEHLSRRSALALIMSAPFVKARTQQIVRGHGKIWPPLLVPDLALVRYDGVSTTLRAMTTGYVTAVQLMFTSCTTTCPMGAAAFQQVQKIIPDMRMRRIQLLSLSIDPENDTPKAMAAWRRRFHSGPNWLVAAPVPDQARTLQDFFQKGGDSSDHSTQVQILNREGRLVWRTYELPPAEEVSSVLQKV